MKLRNYPTTVLFYLLFLTPLFTPIPAEADQAVELPVVKHTLTPGEHLIDVLRTTYKVPDNLIFNEYLNLIKELNPELENLNSLPDHQTILIPLTLPSKNKKYKVLIKDSKVVSITTTTSIPVRETIPPPAPAFEKRPLPQEVDLIKLLKESLAPLVTASGAILQQEGFHTFPALEGTQLLLDTSLYPKLQLKNNTIVIIDTKNQLSPDLKKVINAQWSNYTLLSPDQDLKSILDLLFREMGFFKLVKRGEPLVRGQEVLFKIEAEWIIYPESSLQNVFVINLVNSVEQKIPPPILHHLGTLGVTLIEVERFAREKAGSSPEEMFKGEEASVPAIPKITLSDKPAFIDSLLELAGQEYSKDMPISVYGRESTSPTLDITIDRTFIKEGKKYLICFQDTAPESLDLIVKQGFPLLRLTSQDDAATAIKKVFDFLGIKHHSPLITIAAHNAPQGNNIWITIPSISFDRERKKILLTHLELPPALIGFLAGKGIHTIIYQ